MRNLKKVLSLALALVMLVGMMVVGAGAADYTDADSIKNEEAVAVLNALDVIKGFEDGSYKPEATMNRAQAAIVIARMLLGSGVDNLSVVSQRYTDVPASHWAAKEIEFCSQMGIVSGVGNDKYNPAGKVTGVQFAKMLLCALGYDEAKEGYTGDNWANAVANAARKTGLTANVLLSSEPMTRDAMAQIAFNTLTADLVEYTGRDIQIGEIVIPGSNATTIKHGDSAPNSDSYNNRTAAGTAMKFCEQYFPDLKLTDDTDDFGRAAKVWTVDDEDTYSKPSVEPVMVYTSNMDTVAGKAQIAKDLKGYTALINSTQVAIDNSTNQNYAFTYTNNGDGTASVSQTNTTMAAKIASLTGDGKIVEVYANNDKECTIVVVNKTVGKLTADPSTRTVGDDTQVRVPGLTGLGSYSSSKTTENVFGWDGLAKGDVVLYVTAGGNTYIEKCETTISGVVTGTKNGALRVDGEYYSVSGLANAETGWKNNDFKSEYTFYLDDGGFIVAGSTEEKAETPTQYAVVLSNGWFKGSNLTEGEHGEAQLLFSDGSVEVVTVSKVNGADATSSSTNVAGLTNGKLVTYVESDGKYALTNVTTTSVAANDTTGLTVVKGAAQMTSGSGQTTKHTVNANTIFLVRTGESASDYAYTAYVGNTNVPSMEKAGAEILVEKNIAKVVYITGGTASATTSSDYVYIPGTSVTYTAVPNEKGNGVAYYEVEDAIINGVEETLKVKVNTGNNVAEYNADSASKPLAAKTLYKVVSTEADTGAVTLFKENNASTGVTLSGGTLVVGGSTAFTTNEETEIFRITKEDESVETIAWDGSFSDATDKTVVVASEGVAKTVYILEDVKSDKAVTAVTVRFAGASDSAVGSGGTTTAATASKVTVDDVISLDITVSAGASVTNVVVAESSTATGTKGGETYKVLAADEKGSGAAKTVVFTITVEAEDGSDTTATFTLTLPDAITAKA